MVQQIMDFIGGSWANTTQKEEIVDLDGNTSQHFQLMVPRKKKKKKLKQQMREKSSRYAYSTILLPSSLMESPHYAFRHSIYFGLYILAFIFLEDFGLLLPLSILFLIYYQATEADDPSAPNNI